MLHQLLLISDILADVGLVETHDGHWVRVTAIRRGFSGDPESQRQVTHRVHDNTLVLVRVFRDPAKPRFDHIVSVEKLLLGRRLQPDLVVGVRRQVIERGHVEPELLRLGELAEASSKGKQVLSRHMRSLGKKECYYISFHLKEIVNPSSSPCLFHDSL